MSRAPAARRWLPAVIRDLAIRNVVPLDLAEAGDVAFLDNKKYLPQLATTRASACFLAPDMVVRAPAGLDPARDQGALPGVRTDTGVVLSRLRSAADDGVMLGERAQCIPRLEIGEGVVIEHGAVIGREARIGAGTRIASGAVIGYRCWIGKDCYIGPCASVGHAIIGDRVILHAGVRHRAGWIRLCHGARRTLESAANRTRVDR